MKNLCVVCHLSDQSLVRFIFLHLEKTSKLKVCKNHNFYCMLHYMLYGIDDWKCDQWRWSHFGRKMLKTEPVICKTYYNYVDSNNEENKKFRRYVYTVPSSAKPLTLIHYKGDNSVVENEREHMPYVRTCPSVLKELQQTSQSPSVVYKKKVSISNCPLQHQPVLVPRNRKQVANFQALQRQKLRLSHDALYNLHELSYDLSEFIHKIVTFPDLIVVCGMKCMLRECNRLLKLKQTSPQLMSYDTTFQLGDFYVSPLLFRNTLFKSSPVMPAMFVIHERKLKATHDEMMQLVALELPHLVTGTTAVPLVTDDEKGFTESINHNLPNVRRFLCWNHAINAVKVWLRKHGAASDEMPVYVSHLRDLFHQETQEDYEQHLKEFKVTWSEAFLNYYMEEVHAKVWWHIHMLVSFRHIIFLF